MKFNPPTAREFNWHLRESERCERLARDPNSAESGLMPHPASGETVPYGLWKAAEIARIMDKYSKLSAARSPGAI